MDKNKGEIRRRLRRRDSSFVKITQMGSEVYQNMGKVPKR